MHIACKLLYTHLALYARLPPMAMMNEMDIGNSEMNTAEEVADGGNLESGGGHASMAQPYHGNVEDVSVGVPVPDYDEDESEWLEAG